MVSLIQMEYIVTLANTGQFSLAAEKCFVTQPTLSMQIKKLENDLGVIIFDRTKQPVKPTDIGLLVIEQARIILAESKKIPEIIKQSQNEVKGNLIIGIIPSVAPYLLPLFVGDFARSYPDLSITIKEMLSHEIVSAMSKDEIDVGILSTPMHDPGLNERVLFYEKILLYCNKEHALANKSKVSVNEIENENIWLLSDGHCFRNQAINLCSIEKKENQLNFSYESASIETLIKLVDTEGGMTLIPELAVEQFTQLQKGLAKEIVSNPVREISLISNRIFVKQGTLDVLFKSITKALPASLKSNSNDQVVEWK